MSDPAALDARVPAVEARGPRGARGRHRDLRRGRDRRRRRRPRPRRARPVVERRRRRAGGRRDDLRPRVADQGARHDAARDAARGRRPLRDDRSRRPLVAGLVRPGPRRHDARRSARARLRPRRAPTASTKAGAARWPSPTRSAACRSRRRCAPPRSTAISGSSCSASCSSASATPGSPRRSRRCCGALTDAPLAYRPPAAWRPRTASTGWEAWRQRELIGEVHDANTWAMDGVAAHAGLFGTAGAVGDVGRAVLRALRGDGGRRPGEPGHGPPVRDAPHRRAGHDAGAGLGHDEADVVVRALHEPDARSATPASPARRCGSTTSATPTSCCSPTASRPARPADAMRTLRQGVHDAIFGPAA